MRHIIVLIYFILLGFFLFSCNNSKDEIPTEIKPIPNKPKVSFHIQYYGELNCRGRDVVYLDLWNFSKEDIKKCKETGTKVVIAYMTSQWSPWYPDSGAKNCLGSDERYCKDKFKEHYLGKHFPDWPKERFVNPKLKEVRQIMIERIELANEKGFNGIDVDNTDMYSFDTGFNTSKKDTINYINFFIEEAHKRGMKFSLKNSMTIMNEISPPDYFQNESCYRYNECSMYDKVRVPVFIISYKRKCPKYLYPNGYTIVKKKMNENDKECQ